ncbi:oxidoreductase NAD-binding domain-containing protein 1 isoform X3 [Nycticebus coucang]|uniref:oxidoreductase NAD-binding domain-containing protein 1 isoform X3 n=1 Tax=Nycticebus coucang TaxID=9470 RepID=UPI00234D4737|nr:oxidoreductase NAD-binding domain-containing protein 1 isoform X3 [Nycticebus coucang]
MIILRLGTGFSSSLLLSTLDLCFLVWLSEVTGVKDRPRKINKRSHKRRSIMACPAALIPGLLSGSVGAICSQAPLLRLTPRTLCHLTLARIDFFIPGVSVVGGFSICSSPRLLEQERMIELAVKYTNHPPALWIHNKHLFRCLSSPADVTTFPSFALNNSWVTEEAVHGYRPAPACALGPAVTLSCPAGPGFCFLVTEKEEEGTVSLSSMTATVTKISSCIEPDTSREFSSTCTLDSEVAVRVGGEFFFDPQPADASRNLVLIAGGVGINPLLSILRHSADLHREQANKGSGYKIGTIKLFYSAKNTSELLFKKNILDLVNEFPEKITCSLHVTKQTTQISAELKPYITEGRITEKEIRDHISKETLFYICGPPPMTDFFSKQLENSHVPKEHICFEKWW